MSNPLRLRFEDLIGAAQHGRLLPVLGRDTELQRMARTLSRRTRNNLVLTGPPGVGKTALVEGFAAACVQAAGAPGEKAFPSLPIIRLDQAQCTSWLYRSFSPAKVSRIRGAFASLPPCVVVIDELGALLNDPAAEGWELEDILQPFFRRTDLRLLATMTEEEERAFIQGKSRVEKYVESFRLSSPAPAVCADILVSRARTFSAQYRIAVPPDVLRTAVELSAQVPLPRALPDRALQLVDEACAHCRLRKGMTLSEDDLRAVAAERSGMPTNPSLRGGHGHLHDLTATLRHAIHGQDHAVSIVSNLLQRSWLGLRNPARPLGSFLFLGPSGVGKTELARVLSREVYGSEHAFVRIDLAEYHEAHSLQRLIGAPPGYVGHEAGGQLTTPIAARPFTLILLDELEKADTAVLDAFLHVLEDGRLTDGKGTTVDFTKTIIIATSNLGADFVRRAAETGKDVAAPAFVGQHLVPVLLRRFRTEFVNRFDSILAFNPLSLDDLTTIGLLELRKIEARLERHRVRFRVSPAALRAKARALYDPRFGARPLKRYLEALCENAVAERVLPTPRKP